MVVADTSLYVRYQPDVEQHVAADETRLRMHIEQFRSDGYQISRRRTVAVEMTPILDSTYQANHQFSIKIAFPRSLANPIANLNIEP